MEGLISLKRRLKCPNKILLGVCIFMENDIKKMLIAMAVYKIRKSQMLKRDNNVVIVEEEKWIKHYSSFHKILLVGEGDFSFAVCLAKAFGSATNITATSLDSKAELVKYSKAKENLEQLQNLGCTIIHEVDAHTMGQNPLLKDKYFDKIVFNFPHATLIRREHDWRQIKLHQNVVKGFLKSARDMLSKNGEVHVTHKTAHPFSNWGIVNLGEEVGLYLAEEERFDLSDYPGYENKKGYSPYYNSTFPVGKCSTYKFKPFNSN